MIAETSPDATARSRTNRTKQIAIAAVLVVLVLAYSIGIVLGVISADRKIDAVHLALIVVTIFVVAVLVHPEIFDRFKRLKLSGFEVELLEKVREKQAVQENQLEDIRLILPLLLPDTERKHLLNLNRGKTGDYRGGHALRVELRRLRSIGLLEMKGGKHISDLKDGAAFDLADVVKLAPLGERWVARIKEIEEADAAQITRTSA
jgi:hypothetical protein